MKEIIERGYLYIAQPPLYKVKRSGKEIYIKNNRELQEYLFSGILEDVKLCSVSGEVLGVDLRSFLDIVIKYKDLVMNLAKKLPVPLLEALAIEGFYEIEQSDSDYSECLTRITARLVAQEDDVYNVLWSAAEAEAGKTLFKRIVRGIEECYLFDKILLQQSDFKKFIQLSKEVSHYFVKSCKIVMKGDEKSFEVKTPFDFYNTLFELSKKGISLQRFKGLGEMNADQLWDTTLNPENRSLLQVKIEDIDKTEEMFSTLMGSIVEPRRDFIQAHADEAKNVDV